jgi:hypothetical protein
MTPWTLTLNGQVARIASVADLRAALTARASIEFDEVWLEHESGRAICMLRNRDRAMLMFLRDREGDPGMTSRDLGATSDAPIRFRLTNGQIDEFPSDWTIPADYSVEALAQFYATATVPVNITWRER